MTSRFYISSLRPLLRLSVFLALTSLCYSLSTTVSTSSGLYTGRYDSAKRVYSWKGVPFAKSPIGALRWEMPQPLYSSRSATAYDFGSRCSQYRQQAYAGSEDCLFLNVWAPPGDKGFGPLPVMVWIYGGSFLGGHSSEPDYDGTNLVSEHENVIVVSMNYRVGAFGFFARSALGDSGSAGANSGNFGIADQRLALQWVQENIAAFGGDPRRVTLFGESAGAISTCIHLLSPMSAGLFSQAILESGPCDLAGPEDIQKSTVTEWAREIGCPTGDNQLQCMRGKSDREVMEVGVQIGALTSFGPKQVAPYLDGYIIPESPGTLLEQGRFARVPVIFGSNSNEMSLFVIGNPAWQNPSDSEYATMLEFFSFGDTGVKSAYAASNFGGSNRDALVALLSDRFFICGNRRMARTWDRYNVPSFVYSFNHAPSSGAFVDSGVGDWAGAFHYAEVPYVFNNLPSATTLVGAPNAEEVVMSQHMRNWWRRFTASGNPNGAMSGSIPQDTPYWPQFSSTADVNLNIDTPISTEKNRYTRCQAWDEFVRGTVPEGDRVTSHFVGDTHGKDSNSKGTNVGLILGVAGGALVIILLFLVVGIKTMSRADNPMADKEMTAQ